MDYQFNTCFFEQYAKLTLEDNVGPIFANLKNADRPDLQDRARGFGIEVTRAIVENRNAAHELINKMAGAEVTEIDGDYAYGQHANESEAERRYWSLALPLHRIVASKVAKMQNGFYGDYKHFGLYIFTKETMATSDIRDVIAYTQSLQRGGRRQYSFLFLSHIQDLFACDLATGRFRQHPITDGQNRRYYADALAANKNCLRNASLSAKR